MMFAKDENGGTLSEFAIISPFLFLLLFGIIEFSILLHDRAIIINASREGARAGIVFNHPNPISDTDIQQVVTNYCGNYLISFGSGSTPPITTISRAGTAAGDQLTVTVDYTYQFLVFTNLLSLVSGGTIGPVNLEGRTVMRME
jgi:Flp pilus assembly protein TadG